MIFYLFGSLWPQWQLAFKIVTPLLHCAFSATQLHGSRIFWFLWKKQERLLAEVIVGADEESTGGAVGGERKEGRAAERRGSRRDDSQRGDAQEGDEGGC